MRYKRIVEPIHLFNNTL